MNGFVIFIKFSGEDIQDFICRQRILKKTDLDCLDEEWTGSELRNFDEEKELEAEDKRAAKEEL